MSFGLDLFVFDDFDNSGLSIFEASSAIALLTISIKLTSSDCNICSLIQLPVIPRLNCVRRKISATDTFFFFFLHSQITENSHSAILCCKSAT